MKEIEFDVELTATFSGPDTTMTVSGFYAGNGVFKVRFMPKTVGKWTYLWKYIRNLWGGDQSFLLDHSGSALRCDGYHGQDRIIYYWMSVYDRTAGDALFKVQGTGKTK